jgi:triphosphoribosyl-dephospho-CoA synthase
MLFATGGSNTHRGAIWTLGLLAGSASINETASNALSLAAAAIARTAAKLASFEDSHQLPLISNGQIAAKKFGVSGARGEASEGFPHIINIGLPMLRARRTAHAPEKIARLDALLAIMAKLDDTCLLYRGGKSALRAAKIGAAAVIRSGGAGSARGREQLLALDLRLIELGVSPGGSADLLSGVLFLDAVEADQLKIQPDESMLETDDGTVRI